MAQDLTTKRQTIINNAMVASADLVDALNKLLVLKEQRAELDQDFQEADFIAGLNHATAAMMGTLFDFVVPSLQTNYLDVANGGRNQQILLQVRK
jgi:hypothetical protein